MNYRCLFYFINIYLFQLSEANDKLKIELDGNIRLKKQHQDIQKNCSQLERSYNDMHDKYQELIAIKLKFEKDINTQQANIDQEKSAKYMALDKIQELEGIDIYLLAMD